jgi:nitrite reductase/ring-hydroxylating ferredoxin subunit
VSSGPDYVAVADAAELAEGALRSVEVDGRPVLLAKVGGAIYAIGGVCTHQHALLAEGDLDGEVVTCPLHMSGFDVRTGEATSPPATEAVPVYDVRVEGGKVLVSARPK